MPLGSDHLTGETAERTLTFPGQAHFAIPNSGRRCSECDYWAPKRKSDKRAVCLKAAAMMRNPDSRQVPRHAVICKYFKEKK